MDIGKEEESYILEPNELPEPLRVPAPEEPAPAAPEKTPEREREKVPA